MLERLDTGSPNALSALTYHRIIDVGAEEAPHGLAVSPELLEAHLDALGHHYTFVSLADVIDARRGTSRLPRHSLLLTFDDGYEDFEQYAWPILSSRHLPATIFVPTAYPDHSDQWFWWDRLGELVTASRHDGQISTAIGTFRTATLQDRKRAFVALRAYLIRFPVADAMAALADWSGALPMPPPRNEVLGWERLRRLAAAGVAIAPHSRTHRFLPAATDAELTSELSGSLDDLRRHLEHVHLAFAYPAGGHDDRVIESTEAAGYLIAFTTRRVVNDLRRGRWLALGRINVGSTTHPTLIRAQVGRWALDR